MLRPLAVPLLLLQMLDVRAEQPQFQDRVGDAYEIRLESVSEKSHNGSSGQSRSQYTLVERVIALHAGGIELEFDLLEQASPQGLALGSFRREFSSRRCARSNCLMGPSSKFAFAPGCRGAE